jgi:hypothetical protein
MHKPTNRKELAMKNGTRDWASEFPVAYEILRQLGGGKVLVMTGAKETQPKRQFSEEDFAPLTKEQVWIMVLSTLAQISVVVLMLCVIR